MCRCRLITLRTSQNDICLNRLTKEMKLIERINQVNMRNNSEQLLNNLHHTTIISFQNTLLCASHRACEQKIINYLSLNNVACVHNKNDFIREASVQFIKIFFFLLFFHPLKRKIKPWQIGDVNEWTKNVFLVLRILAFKFL